jgi:hypothetical protein
VQLCNKSVAARFPFPASACSCRVAGCYSMEHFYCLVKNTTILISSLVNQDSRNSSHWKEQPITYVASVLKGCRQRDSGRVKERTDWTSRLLLKIIGRNWKHESVWRHHLELQVKWKSSRGLRQLFHSSVCIKFSHSKETCINGTWGGYYCYYCAVLQAMQSVSQGQALTLRITT